MMALLYVDHACDLPPSIVVKVRSCVNAGSTNVNVVASWVVGQFEMANCIFAKQKMVNSEHLSVEPVSYKIQEPLGCIYI
jgi:hypothetical protein